MAEAAFVSVLLDGTISNRSAPSCSSLNSEGLRYERGGVEAAVSILPRRRSSQTLPSNTAHAVMELTHLPLKIRAFVRAEEVPITDFATRFAHLKTSLDDPDALFPGAEMRDELLALEPLLADRASEARLFCELALLEGKRGDVICLEHADRALAAHAETGALPVEKLYFMHLVCGDVGTAWRGGPRTAMHLEGALALHPQSGRPRAEAFAIRLNRGVHEDTMGTARMGLDWYEPLLADAERDYGNDSKELSRLLGLMSASEEKLGNMKQALAYGERSCALIDDRVDRGRRVSALVTFARLNHRAGKRERLGNSLMRPSPLPMPTPPPLPKILLAARS